MTNAERQLGQLRAKYNASDGVLPKNEVIENLTNKIVKQKYIKTFDFTNKLLKRYLESTPLVGGVDELINVGLGHLEQFDMNVDWTKERFIPEINAEWSMKLFEDKYYYTIMYQKMAQALVGMNQVGSLIQSISDGVFQQKQFTWYTRMLDILENDKNYIEIKIDEKEGEDYALTVGKEISRISREMTLPNKDFNFAKRLNATPVSKQNLIMNLDTQLDIEWSSARIYNLSNLTELSKMMYVDFVKFSPDKKILATLDTVDKLYLAEKYRLNGVFGNISLKYANYYLHEEYHSVVLPWVDGIRFVEGARLVPEKK